MGSRGPVFCSGHDLGEMVGRSEEEYRELFALCSRVMLGLRRLPQPVIARVQGVATAAGCQLVAACDLAVAAEEATFATPGVKIGLFCTTPMVPLVRAIPAKPAAMPLVKSKVAVADVKPAPVEEAVKATVAVVAAVTAADSVTVEQIEKLRDADEWPENAPTSET